MQKQEYNVDFFINKFENIPENKWCVEELSQFNGFKFLFFGRKYKFCALGHCNWLGFAPQSKASPDEGKSLSNLMIGYLDVPVENINDGIDERYPQKTPKQRILAALRDIKKIIEKGN